MIITNIIGGIGNQLFQYYFGRKIADLNNTSLKLDNSGFESYDWHKFELNKFNLKYNIASKEDVEILLKENLHDRVIQKLLPYYRRRLVKQNVDYYDSNLLKIKDNSYLKGYWQCEKYFLSMREEILKEVTLKSKFENEHFKELKKDILKNNSISIHVRRGNYLDLKVPVCSVEYYESAINLISKSIKNFKIYIFTNDVKWCRENFSEKYNIKIISGQENIFDYHELILMSYCSNNIISNSTFSWWAGWLNNSPNKKIIYPKITKKTLNKDLFLDEWVLI
ncbi:MAG: hypothetical protein CL827_01195 [Crocinitomicaceae bacterium]|nr:hypothetical protein [Crocinitomicaceae bacterium]|tara:strand:+ start:1037 stop:1876 length:840 start_codon:yes stop_codon:yes gene_type:complete